MIQMSRTTADPETLARLRDWLRHFRDDIGLSQRAIANELEISEAHVSELISGKKDVGLGTFVRMRRLHRNANEMLDRNPESATAAGPPQNPRRASKAAGARGRDAADGGEK